MREGAAWWPAWAAKAFDLPLLAAAARRLVQVVLGPAVSQVLGGAHAWERR